MRTIAERLVVIRVRVGDDHALDVERVNETRKGLGPSEHGRDALTLLRARPDVDEADEVEPVFLVVPDLPGDHLADIALADDEGVLAKSGEATCSGPGCNAAADDERHRKEPERQQLREVRVRDLERPRDGDEQPGDRSEQAEDGACVVDRRVVAPLAIAVVQPDQLRRDDPARQRDDEQQELFPACDGASFADPPLGEPRDDEKREAKADDVGRQQHPANEPAPAYEGGPERPDERDRAAVRARDLDVARGIHTTALFRLRSRRGRALRWRRISYSDPYP